MRFWVLNLGEFDELSEAKRTSWDFAMKLNFQCVVSKSIAQKGQIKKPGFNQVFLSNFE